MNAPHPTPTAITVPAGLFFSLVEQLVARDNFFGDSHPDDLIVARSPRALPAIGDPFDGGIYAGITLHDGRAMALVLHDDEADELTHEAALKWAEERAQELPTRIDMLVLLKNVPGHFKKYYYWTSETRASDGDYAWVQDFFNGYQGYDRQDDRCRARAVRRVSI